MSGLVILLAIFLSVYGAVHLYLLIKLRRAYYLEGPGYVLLFVVLAYLMLAPIHASILESQGYSILALVSAWIGYCWMGLLFIFLCLALPIDAYHLFMSALQSIANADLTHLMLSRRQSFTFAAAATLIVALYGAFEAQQIHIEQVTLHSPKIPPALERIRIVQISDLHLGPMMFPARVVPIAEAAKAARPDLLVCTGDLVDGRIYQPNVIEQLLLSIPAPLGKFAVTGNHEFYFGIEKAKTFIQQAGFTLLQGESRLIKDALCVVGVDDPTGGKKENAVESAVLAQQPKDRFTLLLKHRPVVEKTSLGRFDLQLSGHTHGGQIFPFGLVLKWRYPMGHGLHELNSQSKIYISRGSGCWGPPLRVLAPPEVTIIDLLPANTPSQLKKTGGKN